MVEIFIYIAAGLAAGIGTGFAGLSAATLISPILVTFLNMDAYTSITVALAADVLASAVTAVEYGINKNVDLKNGLLMMVTVLIFTAFGSWAASFVPDRALGIYSVVMPVVIGFKFLLFPVTSPKEKRMAESRRSKIITSLICGVIVGFGCGFFGVGGGMVILIVLTVFMGYELKTAVGTSVFIMIFCAATGAGSRMIFGEIPDITALAVCAAATFVGAVLSASVANKVSGKTLNRVTGAVLVLAGAALIAVQIVNGTLFKF